MDFFTQTPSSLQFSQNLIVNILLDEREHVQAILFNWWRKRLLARSCRSFVERPTSKQVCHAVIEESEQSIVRANGTWTSAITVLL